MTESIIVLKNGFNRNQSHTSSAITTARTKMTANELKAFYQCSTLIQKDDDKFAEYVINVKDFVETLEFSDTNGNYVKELCRHLAKQTFEIEKNGIWEIYTIFSRFRFDTKNQLITIKFNEDMRPFLLELKNNFTQIKQVKYIREFDSKYTIRIYALLKDYRKMGHRDINIEALSKMLRLPKSYSNFKFIRVKVLEPAMKEINEKSDLEIQSIEPIEKRGKKIIAVRITFNTRSDKVAVDCIKMLYQKLQRNNGDLANAFIGYDYSITDEPMSRNEIRTIGNIEVDENDCYTCKDTNNETIFTATGKKEFTDKIIKRIYSAVKFLVEKEKNLFVALPDWQTKQDKIKEFKEKFAQMLDKYDTSVEFSKNARQNQISSNAIKHKSANKITAQTKDDQQEQISINLDDYIGKYIITEYGAGKIERVLQNKNSSLTVSGYLKNSSTSFQEIFNSLIELNREIEHYEQTHQATPEYFQKMLGGYLKNN